MGMRVSKLATGLFVFHFFPGPRVGVGSRHSLGLGGAGQREEAPCTVLLLPPTLAPLDVPSSDSTGAQAQAACGYEPLESPRIFSTRDSGTTEVATLPLSLPRPVLCSGRQDGMKGHDPQTRPAHLTPTLFSGPASDFGQGRASWPNGSFVSPTVPWTPDCSVLSSLSTEHPLAGTLAGFQKQDTPSGPRGPADS